MKASDVLTPCPGAARWRPAPAAPPPAEPARAAATPALAGPRRARAALATALMLVVLGIVVHTAHHLVAPGQTSDCPVLAAAQHLPWTPAESPLSWAPVLAVAPLVAALARPRPSGRRARLRPGRAPPPRPA
jgi:hypothetical protein